MKPEHIHAIFYTFCMKTIKGLYGNKIVLKKIHAYASSVPLRGFSDAGSLDDIFIY